MAIPWKRCTFRQKQDGGFLKRKGFLKSPWVSIPKSSPILDDLGYPDELGKPFGNFQMAMIPPCCLDTDDLVMTNSSPWKITMLLIGKPSINGSFPMAMLNNQRVHEAVK